MDEVELSPGFAMEVEPDRYPVPHACPDCLLFFCQCGEEWDEEDDRDPIG
jgi:hypothetical protein